MGISLYLYSSPILMSVQTPTSIIISWDSQDSVRARAFSTSGFVSRNGFLRHIEGKQTWNIL